MSMFSQGLLALFLALATPYVSSVGLRRGAPQNDSIAGHLTSVTSVTYMPMGSDFPADNADANAVPAFQVTRLQPPCQCVSNDPLWVKPVRTIPKCIFIDLGAANGNTFTNFLQNAYGPVSACPSGQWEAFLVEANPTFDGPLKLLEQQYPGQVHSLASTAAFTCQGQTSFYIDTDASHNHWGSSMSPTTPDVLRSGQVQVTVPTINVIELIARHVIPGDWVMLKVDIEGAEYELIPCLSMYTDAALVDRIHLEQHTWYADTATTPAQMEAAKAKLKMMGVDIPDYFTHTFLVSNSSQRNLTA